MSIESEGDNIEVVTKPIPMHLWVTGALFVAVFGASVCLKMYPAEIAELL